MGGGAGGWERSLEVACCVAPLWTDYVAVADMGAVNWQAPPP